MRRALFLSAVLFVLLGAVAVVATRRQDPRLQGASRAGDRNGWIQVHLEGPPATLGFQHGYLLAPEIQDAFAAVRLELTHTEGRDWGAFRDLAREVLWPRVEAQYREELQGLVEGLRARGAALDLWDLVAFNAWLELPYLLAAERPAPARSPAEHCSAFVATGSWTRDGQVLIAHNNWSSYLAGAHWNIVFDVVPAAGHAFTMDGMPGLIHSGDDFGVNAAGLMITETTIGGFVGFDRSGIPEFVRARKAMQFADSIDAFAAIMQAGNNGGYANDWLVADRKTGEIASLELGLKHATLQRTKDGCFVGANFPKDPALLREETRSYDPKDRGRSANCRRERWEALMEARRGRLDLATAKAFLADHADALTGREEPSDRTLCGHIDLSPRGMTGWMPPYGIAGAVQSKVSDGTLGAALVFEGALGHACGRSFSAAEHLAAHPEFEWQRPLLRDLPARPWTRFSPAK